MKPPLALILLCLILTGCIPFWFQTCPGPISTPVQCNLLKDHKVLLVCSEETLDYKGSSIVNQIGQTIESTLEQQTVNFEIIECINNQEERDIQELAKHTQSEMIVHVIIERFHIEVLDDAFRGDANVLIEVFENTNGTRRVWSYSPLHTDLFEKEVNVKNEEELAIFRKRYIQHLGHKIAQHFITQEQ